MSQRLNSLSKYSLHLLLTSYLPLINSLSIFVRTIHLLINLLDTIYLLPKHSCFSWTFPISSFRSLFIYFSASSPLFPFHGINYSSIFLPDTLWRVLLYKKLIYYSFLFWIILIIFSFIDSQPLPFPNLLHFHASVYSVIASFKYAPFLSTPFSSLTSIFP